MAMRTYLMTTASLRAGIMHSIPLAFLLAPVHATQGPGGGRRLAFAAFTSWLLTEGLGAYMLRRLLAAGDRGRRRLRPRGVSRPVMFGHAGLALTGFVSWIGFLVTSSAAFAWLAVGLLAPAIGLGISTVTVWTPYPGARVGGEGQSRADQRDRDGASPLGPERAQEPRAEAVTTDVLADALRDEARTSRLVDDLLASMLAEPPPPARKADWRLSPLIPAAHGVLAFCTFLFAMLAAVAATSAGT